MGLDIKDALEVIRHEAVSYAAWFTSALSSPTYIARKAEEWETAKSETVVGSASSSQFFVVLVISTVIGATVGAVIPGRPPLKDRFTVFVVVVLVWYLISILTHAVVRLLRGQGKTGTTVRAMMQLLALVYVLSNVACLLMVSAAGSLPPFKIFLESTGFGEPGTILVSIQFLLLLFYLPLTIRRAHGFRGVVAGCAAGLFGATCAAVVASLLVAQNSC